MKIAAANIAPSYTLVATQGNCSGGTALLLHPTISVLDLGRLTNRNLIWARIEYQGHSLHVAVVYGPHTPGHRAQFWKHLNLLLPYRKWILVGDSNSVERPNQTSGHRNQMIGEEENNFHSLKLKYTLSDAYDLAEERFGPSYTRHIAYGNEFHWVTLDRIYLLSDAPWLEAMESLNHQAEYTLSDHMPVSIALAIGSRLPKGVKLRTYFKYDAYLMAQPEINLRLHELWEQETEGVEDPMKAYCKGWAIMRDLMKAKQQEQSIQISKIEELGKKLKECHEALPPDPSDE
ncbi:hypothetical protein R1flu_007992 [Riccia fluitans]|uniref:Endonuclease/exonuclease/phosphatase domain-containing protein n=1 Tax=Riccia fluitans TaxID=41844 RepID=A0ABD1YDX0_9MARC